MTLSGKLLPNMEVGKMAPPRTPESAPRNGVLLVTLTVNDLRALVLEALGEVLVEQQNPTLPSLLTQTELAQVLQVDVRTVYALRRKGLPQLIVGDSPRFDLPEVLTWLRNRSQLADEANDKCSQVAENKNVSRSVQGVSAVGVSAPKPKRRNSKHLRAVEGKG